MNHRVLDLFELAIAQPDDRRYEFLERECGGDPGLLQQLLELLESDRSAARNEFLGHSPLHPVADALDWGSVLRPEQSFGRYRIVRRIGMGGMGEVYLAEDTDLGRNVALKVIRSLLRHDEILRRFANERRILARLNHDNIARLLDIGSAGPDTPFLVMEYVEGETIDAYCDARRLSIAARLALFRTVCSAVQYAHRNLVIHRDLKPSNILVTSHGQVKLLDFGIAKILDPQQTGGEQTATALRAMTPEYASPEQVRGQPATTAADIYSLGVLLYKLMTGVSPYRVAAGQPAELAEAICAKDPERPSASVQRADPAAVLARSHDRGALQRRLRGDLDNIVMMALRKEPERRYASADQFSEDIRRYLGGMPVMSHRDTVAYRAAKFVRRHSVAVGAAIAIFLTLLAGIAGTAWQAHIARIERARAERRFNDVRKLATSLLFEFDASIEGVPGTLAARQLIVRRATEYLDSLTQEAGDDRPLKSELADAYNKVGTITFDVAQRLSIHRKELALRDALARSEPSNPAFRKQLAVSYIAVGDAVKDTGDLRGALENYRRALAIGEALRAEFPRPEYQFDVAVPMQLTGQMLDRMDRIGEALADHLKALEILKPLLDSDSPNRDNSQLNIVLQFDISRDLAKSGDLNGAMEYARAGLSAAESMSALDPSNAVNRRNIWVSHMRLAELLLKMGNGSAGLAQYRIALPQIQALSAADPGDKGHRRALSVTCLALADALARTGNFTEALSNYKRALSISTALLASDPNKLETRADLAAIYSRMGIFYSRRGDAAQALPSLKKGLALYESAAEADPANAEIGRGRAEALAALKNLTGRQDN